MTGNFFQPSGPNVGVLVGERVAVGWDVSGLRNTAVDFRVASGFVVSASGEISEGVGVFSGSTVVGIVADMVADTVADIVEVSIGFVGVV
jgi:hypothetical protein